MPDQLTDDGLEILDEGQGSLGEKVGDFVRGAPLVVFGVLSVVALLVIVGVVRFAGRNDDTASLPPVPIELRTAQQLVAVSSDLVLTLAEEDRFLTETHPLLSLDEIRQSSLPDGFLGPEVGRYQRMRLALASDLRETIRRADNRSRTFDATVAGLAGVEDEAVTSYLRLTDLDTVLRERIAKLAFDERAAQATFDASLASGVTPDGAALQEILRIREETAQLRARHAFVADVRDAYPSEILALRARIAGAIANREIIIRDLYAVDIDGAGITLVREGTAEQYYASARLPSATLGKNLGSGGFGGLGTGFGGTSPIESLSASGNGLPLLQLEDGGPGTVPMIRLPMLSS